jgi:hypothetical protein
VNHRANYQVTDQQGQRTNLSLIPEQAQVYRDFGYQVKPLKTVAYDCGRGHQQLTLWGRRAA